MAANVVSYVASDDIICKCNGFVKLRHALTIATKKELDTKDPCTDTWQANDYISHSTIKTEMKCKKTKEKEERWNLHAVSRSMGYAKQAWMKIMRKNYINLI